MARKADELRAGGGGGLEGRALEGSEAGERGPRLMGSDAQLRPLPIHPPARPAQLHLLRFNNPRIRCTQPHRCPSDGKGRGYGKGAP